MGREVRLMQGNQAMAEGAFYAGARFYAGYPITPSSEIAEECSKKMPLLGGIYMQMEDEIASMAAIIGASLAGAKAFTATSGPGFSLMQENMGVAVMGEVPCVVIDVQRFGPSTGLANKPAQSDIMQLRWGRHGDQCVIALCPATVKECFMLTVRPGHGTHISPSAGDSFSKPLRWGMFVGWCEKLHEFIEARITIEQALVGMAAERATEKDIPRVWN